MIRKCLSFLTLALALIHANAQSVFNQADSLYIKGIELYNNNKYEDACILFSNCDSINRLLKRELPYFSNNALTWKASCLYKLGREDAIDYSFEYDLIPVDQRHTLVSDSLAFLSSVEAQKQEWSNAICLAQKSADFELKVLGHNHYYYANSLANISYYFEKNNNIDSSIEYANRAIAIYEKSLTKKGNFNFANVLYRLSNLEAAINKYDEALALAKRSYNMVLSLYGPEHLYTYSLLKLLIIRYREVRNYKEAIEVINKAMSVISAKYGEEHPDYIACLNNLAVCNNELGHHAIAKDLYEKVLLSRERAYGKEHALYALTLLNYSNTLFSLGKKDEAIESNKEVLRIYEKIFDNQHPDYLCCKSNLASKYMQIGNFIEAKNLFIEVLHTREKLFGKKHPLYAVSLNNLASCYACIGDYNKSILLNKEALALRKLLYGEEHQDYAQSLNNLAEDYSALGNISEAIRFNYEALKIREQVLGKMHPDYALSLNNLAVSYSNLGDYKEAIRLQEEALIIREKIYGKEHPDYAESLTNLAVDYDNLEDHQKAVEINEEALRIAEKIYGKEHPLYVNILHNLAASVSNMGDYTRSIVLNEEALLRKEKIWGEEHPTVATTLANIEWNQFFLGQLSESIKTSERVLQILKKTMGSQHPDYVRALITQAISCEAIDKKKYTELLNEYLDIKKDILLQSIQGLSVKDRDFLWNSDKYIFEEYYPQKAYQYKSPELISCAYNASLFGKGLLLAAEIETKQIIQECGDEKLVGQYDQMVSNKLLLDKLLEKPLDKRLINADSIQKIIQTLEREILAKSKEYGTLKNNLRIDWHDVQKKLTQEDIAVEFLSFPCGEDSIMYIALTLKKNYDNPKIFPLFEKRQLRDIGTTKIYKNGDLYNLVWKPIEDEIQDVKNIYFSPSGELHTINIEILPLLANMDNRNYIRLSSTRLLACSIDRKLSSGASIYGGLDYNTDISGLVNDSKKYTSTTLSWQYPKDYLRSITVRGGWSFLPATLTEAISIYNEMRASNIRTQLFTDSIGTEASFKAFSSAKLKYLHIATHGFFYSNNNEIKRHYSKNDLFSYVQNLGHNKNIEDKAFYNTGLLLSGCNNILSGEVIPDGVEDGILFAKEIANIDLRGLSLVTLSACETGLGEISGEGVFGLQRAFKKAGAESILMSLWSVDDYATFLLMTRFYENYLTKKMSKAESLKEAQIYVRTYENGIYNDPYFWASFILVDAI